MGSTLQFVEKVESSIIWGDLIRYDGGMQEIMFLSLARLGSLEDLFAWYGEQIWAGLRPCHLVKL